MGHKGNGGTGGMGYKGMGHMGNRVTWAMGYMDNGVQGYGAIGHMGNGAHGQFTPKMSKRCQVVKKMSNVKKSNT